LQEIDDEPHYEKPYHEEEYNEEPEFQQYHELFTNEWGWTVEMMI